LQVIRVISGDNELAALDFQKHYRMPIVYLMDSDRAFERKHNRDGWPFLMLADPNGQIVYKCNNLVDRDKELMKRLQKFEKESFSVKTKTADGIFYITSTLQRSGEDEQPLQNDRFTSITAGNDGKIYAVFTSVKNGNSDIVLRIHNGELPDEDIPVAATDADEYDGTVLIDNNNRIWICWTSNTVDNTYQIHLTSLNDVTASKKSIVVSNSEEDCMHGRMTADDSGNLWITYYRWHKMGTISRDKEVYLRKYSNGALSEEIHISPEDVPEYEDHTDPSVSILNQHVVVTWSWDFHKPKGYTQNAQEPTIFARTINQDLELGNSFHLSGKNIDAAPVLSKPCQDSLWCAWDSLGRSQDNRGYNKTLYVCELIDSGKKAQEIPIAKGLVNICSPCFAFYENQKGALTWSQTQNGKDWLLWKSEYDSQNHNWHKPVLVTSEGNPRFVSCVYDSQGQLWIAYSVQTEKGREINIKKLD
jgi:hypothetical protein